MINRTAAASILKNLTVFPAANIIGPRQVGKTTLAKWLQTQLPKPSIYLDLQNEQDFDRLASPELFLREHQDECVIIDETQRLPALYGHLRSLIDERRGSFCSVRPRPRSSKGCPNRWRGGCFLAN